LIRIESILCTRALFEFIGKIITPKSLDRLRVRLYRIPINNCERCTFNWRPRWRGNEMRQILKIIYYNGIICINKPHIAIYIYILHVCLCAWCFSRPTVDHYYYYYHYYNSLPAHKRVLGRDE